MQLFFSFKSSRYAWEVFFQRATGFLALGWEILIYEGYVTFVVSAMLGAWPVTAIDESVHPNYSIEYLMFPCSGWYLLGQVAQRFFDTVLKSCTKHFVFSQTFNSFCPFWINSLPVKIISYDMISNDMKVRNFCASLSIFFTASTPPPLVRISRLRLFSARNLKFLIMFGSLKFISFCFLRFWHELLRILNLKSHYLRFKIFSYGFTFPTNPTK